MDLISNVFYSSALPYQEGNSCLFRIFWLNRDPGKRVALCGIESSCYITICLLEKHPSKVINFSRSLGRDSRFNPIFKLVDLAQDSVGAFEKVKGPSLGLHVLERELQNSPRMLPRHN